ncbi:hypothetical protein F5Y17DRAFT_219599 [Xylariaceae sp. FL0594]|nr:hypothetical protein F5Y17DRAFT_219599 [Xylariaceae sp. FL0594]
MADTSQVGADHLAPPNPSPSRHASRVGADDVVIIEPTEEQQLFYNTRRRELERQRLGLHPAEENQLELPRSQPMSRSTTGESISTPGTTHSHAGDADLGLSPEPTAKAARPKPPRGKRHGPLAPEVRIKTAFKRRFKLICASHRKSKSSCSCHGFSKLEENYRKFLATEEQDNNSQIQFESGVGTATPAGRDTFGIGVAPHGIPSESEILVDHTIEFQLPAHMQERLTSILDFNIDSEASVNEVVSANRQQTSFLTLPEFVPVGSSTPFQNRWQCEFECASDDSGPSSSVTTCPWTGPLYQLCAHFTSDHHAITDELYCSSCDYCATMRMGWVDTPACKQESGCHPQSWRQWLWSIPAHCETPVGLDPFAAMPTGLDGSGSSYAGLSHGFWDSTILGAGDAGQSNPD